MRTSVPAPNATAAPTTSAAATPPMIAPRPTTPHYADLAEAVFARAQPASMAAKRRVSSSGEPTLMRTEAGSPNGPSGRTITPCALEARGERRAVAHVDAEEVGDALERREAALAQTRGEALAPVARLGAPARDLVARAEARERGVERRLRHVERVLDLEAGGRDIGRAEPVADAEARQAVDLRERAQHDAAPAAREVLARAVGVVGVVDVLEVGLVEHRQHVLRAARRGSARAPRA